MSKKYIIYQAKVYGEVVYIGSGVPGREKHCSSGRSHLYELNKLHFQGVDIIVSIIHFGLSREESLLLEKELIFKHQPKYNTVHKNVISDAITKMNLATAVNTSLYNAMKDNISFSMAIRYKEAIRDIITMIGISKLYLGVYIPSDSFGRRSLTLPSAKTLYGKLRLAKNSEEYKDWLESTFEYRKESAKIWLKIKPEISDIFIPTS